MVDQANRALLPRQVRRLAASRPEASTAKAAAAVTALDQAKIAKVRVARTPKVGVVARTPARLKTAVANRLSRRRLASSPLLPKLDPTVVEVVVEVKARQTVDLVAETAQGGTVVVAAAEEEEEEEVVAVATEVELAGMETMGTEVEMEETVVQAVPMVVTGTDMVQDLARKIHL